MDINSAAGVNSEENMEEMAGGSGFEGQEESTSGFDWKGAFLAKRNRERSLDEYREHSLNFNRSEWFGQILRGIEAMFMELDFAFMDIVVGIMKGVRARREHEAVSS